MGVMDATGIAEAAVLGNPRSLALLRGKRGAVNRSALTPSVHRAHNGCSSFAQYVGRCIVSVTGAGHRRVALLQTPVAHQGSSGSR